MVFSFDAKAKIAIKEYKGNIYTKEEIVKYSAKQKVKGLLDMFAAINIHKGEIIYWFFDWKNSFIVIECPVAHWGLSGATTTTVPISDITAIKALIPGAEIPSSLVTKIRGLSFFMDEVFNVSFQY